MTEKGGRRQSKGLKKKTKRPSEKSQSQNDADEGRQGGGGTPKAIAAPGITIQALGPIKKKW